MSRNFPKRESLSGFLIEFSEIGIFIVDKSGVQALVLTFYFNKKSSFRPVLHDEGRTIVKLNVKQNCR